MSSLENKDKIPDLDSIINQITNNSDFHNMMTQLSDDMTNPDTKNTSDTLMDKQNISKSFDEDDEDDEVSSQVNNYDLMTTFFSDKEGNNICDILSQINGNLSKITNELENKGN